MSYLQALRFAHFALVLVISISAVDVQAQLTHYVPFDAGYGPADLNQQGGVDLGFGTNLWFDGAAEGEGTAVIAGNFEAPAGLPVTGNSARTALSDFNLAYYTFDQNNDGSNGVVGEDNLAAGEHWISFLARADQGAFFAGLSLVKFFGPEVLYIGKVSSTTSDVNNTGEIDGADFLQIQREDPALLSEWELNYGSTNATAWGIDPQDGTGQHAVTGSDATEDTFLVAKLTLGAGANDDRIDLFINPDINAGTPTTPDLTVAFNEDSNDNRSIDEIRLGSQNGSFYTDEIRIGASFADVAPVTIGLSAASVPEPSSVVLLLSNLLLVWTSRLRPIPVPVRR